MALLTVSQVSRAGIRADDNLVAAGAGGDTFPNDGRTFFHIRNGGGSAITVTFAAKGSLEGEPVANRVVNVPNGQDFFIGPFPTNVFNNQDSQVEVTYSGVASVTVRPYRL